MSQHSAKEKIGLATAIIVGMNAMIGAGIFTIPAALTTNMGPIGILSFFIVAVGVWALAQSFARIAQLNPKEGSFYTYASLWGDHTAGSIANMSYLIGLLIAMGLLTHAAGSYLFEIIPFGSEYIMGIITLILLVILNIKGAALSQLGQNILIICTLFPLLATTLLCFTKADISNLTPFAPYGIAPMFSQMDIVIFSFFGFESAASLFNVVKDPEKNLPKAITYSVMLVAGIYLMFVASLLLAIPAEVFKENAGSPLPVILGTIFPNSPLLLKAIHFSCLSAILGTLHSMIWGSSNLLFSFAKKARNLPVQLLIAGNIVTQKTTVLIIGLGIFASFSMLHDNSFFYLTALFLLIAFLLSIRPLLKIEAEWDSGQNYITILGILTAIVIGFFAVKNLLFSFFIA
jgi:amino acid transporter